jgi:hypothetical protein
MLFVFSKLYYTTQRISIRLTSITNNRTYLLYIGQLEQIPQRQTPLVAEVVSWMSFAAAAPLAPLLISRKGSSFAAKFEPSSIVKVVDAGIEESVSTLMISGQIL